MPHVLRWEPHGLVRKFWGHVTSAEFESAIQEALHEPGFQDARYSVLDFEEVSKSELDMTVLERIAMVHFGCGLLHNTEVKVAVVGARADVGARRGAMQVEQRRRGGQLGQDRTQRRGHTGRSGTGRRREGRRQQC